MRRGNRACRRCCSLPTFGELPSALADPACSLPGALVRKEPFVLPWRWRGDLKTPPAALLVLLQEAVRACSSGPGGADDDCDDGSGGDARAETLAACLPIHRNALRVHLGRGACAVRHDLHGGCRDPAGAGGRARQLAETLVQRGDAAEGARAWLGALRRRPRDARLAYHAAKFLAAHAVEEKPIAVLESLAVSFFAEEKAATTELLFRSLLGCPVPYNFRAPDFAAGVSRETLQAQQGYLWLCYCSWQVLASPAAGATDAHEAALGAAQLTEEPLRLLWLDYLTQAKARLLASASKAPELRSFTALVHRCLATVPVRRALPHASAKYWADYTFHNQVVDVYVGCLPPCQRSAALERLHALAPTNAALALRLLVAEAEEGNVHSVALQAKLLIQRLPSCLFIWKIVIAATRKLHGPSELRRLFVRALHCLPLSASLWKDFVLAEAEAAASASSSACGGKGGAPVQRALALCREAGVSLAELLPSSVTLSPGHATS
ncbi:zinc finger C3H1 domain-containing protein-like [Lethenteron reissneri]|uniref:zinc finger C3H1 domain-containing protein-like n=1 Tax=Lethenteron reissneri TaxID=7753 RepID=UPI002AB605F8|nr:zinc finger C3H1 domain-containing protein-like [Lethenteron reissneri]